MIFPPKSEIRVALCFRDFDDFAILVLAAEGAGAVRKHALVATGALGEALGLQVIVGAALRGAALRVASFRIRHGAVSSRIPYFFKLCNAAQRLSEGFT